MLRTTLVRFCCGTRSTAISEVRIGSCRICLWVRSGEPFDVAGLGEGIVNGLLDLFSGCGLVRCEVFHRAIALLVGKSERRWGVQDSDHRLCHPVDGFASQASTSGAADEAVDELRGDRGRSRISTLPSRWNCRSC